MSNSSMLNRCARRGFTLIELMIVMAVIIILISVAIPRYEKSIQRAKETVLKNNLSAIRSAIDEYSYDKQKAPPQLQDLVSDGLSAGGAQGPDHGAKPVEGDPGGRQPGRQFDGTGPFRYSERIK